MAVSANRLLFLAAAILFALAAVGVGALGPLATLPLGLLLMAAGFLAP